MVWRGGSAPFGLLLNLESLNPSALNHGEWGFPPELRSQVTARPRCRQPMTFMVTAEDCMGSWSCSSLIAFGCVPGQPQGSFRL